jgi:hypothetical protein
VGSSVNQAARGIKVAPGRPQANVAIPAKDRGRETVGGMVAQAVHMQVFSVGRRTGGWIICGEAGMGWLVLRHVRDARKSLVSRGNRNVTAWLLAKRPAIVNR